MRFSELIERNSAFAEALQKLVAVEHQQMTTKNQGNSVRKSMEVSRPSSSLNSINPKGK